MLTPRQRLGRRGEELAAAFLEAQGMTVVERNFRAGHGEIDLIARDGDVLVFVEVKTARSDAFGEPELWVDEEKQRLLSETADAYLFRRGIDEVECRFDVVAVDLRGTRPQIRHLRNAFWAEE